MQYGVSRFPLFSRFFLTANEKDFSHSLEMTMRGKRHPRFSLLPLEGGAPKGRRWAATTNSKGMCSVSRFPPFPPLLSHRKRKRFLAFARNDNAGEGGFAIGKRRRPGHWSLISSAISSAMRSGISLSSQISSAAMACITSMYMPFALSAREASWRRRVSFGL